MNVKLVRLAVNYRTASFLYWEQYNFGKIENCTRGAMAV